MTLKAFRDTRQRGAILNTLREHGHPMTAKQLHAKAVALVPSLGIATVYRNIRYLLEAREIEQIDVPGVSSYYTTQREHNTALAVCRESQEVRLVDAKAVSIEVFKDIPEGFEADNIELFLFGRFKDEPGDSRPLSRRERTTVEV